MRSKEAKMQILQQDLAKQIGIVDFEIPQLVFYGEDFKAIHVPAQIKHGFTPSKIGGRNTGMLGIWRHRR